jgi:hypothetical protein
MVTISKMKRWAKIGALSFALLVTAGTRITDAQVDKATISGTATDSSGGVLVGASIQARNVGTGVTQTSVSDAQGRYRIPDLPIGNYEVQASMPGFEAVVHTGITLTVGSNPVVDFSLPVGKATQTVSVESQISQVETQTAAVSSLVTGSQMQDLPLNGRNFEQLLTLAPGVQRIIGNPAGQSAGNSFYGNQDNYSVSGSRPVGQAFLLDNTDITNFWTHGTGSGVGGTSLGIEAIAEFQVLTNTYGAQFGGTGAVINAVSKSGTNEFHGSAYEFFRNSALDSRNYFDGPSVPEFQRNQFGGSLGGPIKKDKLFFFVNYEGLRSSLGQTEDAFVPDAQVDSITGAPGSYMGLLPCGALNSPPSGCSASTPYIPTPVSNSIAPILATIYSHFLPAGPDLPIALPGSTTLVPSGIGEYRSVASLITNENYVLARMDYTLSSQDSLYGRYVSDRTQVLNPFAGSAIPLWPDAEHTANQYVTTEEKHIFSPTVLNLARFTFVRTLENGTTTGETPPLDFFPGSGREDGQLSPTGAATTIGASGLDPFYIIQNKFTEGDDLLWAHGAHSFKVGVSLVRIQTNLSAPIQIGGDFSFATLQSFYQAAPYFFLGASAPTPTPCAPNCFSTNRYFRQTEFFPYFQDDWKVTPTLTLNLGLRWDFATNAVGAGGIPLYTILNPLTSTGFTRVGHAFATNPNWLNLDPRLGLAYDPFKDHKTSIRAGFGIFHEQVVDRTYASAYYLAPPSGATLIVNFTGGAVPYPNPYSIGPLPYTGFAGADYRTDTAPYVMQYNLTIQRQSFGGIVLSLGYVGSQGVHLFSERDQNLPQTTTGSAVGAGSLANPFIGVETNPNFGSLNNAAATSHSSYNSLQVGLNRQLSHNLQGQVSYTYSKCIDDGSVTSSTEQGAYEVTDPYDQSYDRGRCAFDITHALTVNGMYTLPFRGSRLVSGWELTEILSASTGIPVNIQDGFDQSQLGGIEGDRPNYSGASGCHPSQILDVQAEPGVLGGPLQWFNPLCYALQPVGTLGNVGRDSISGPGILDLDFSIIKNTRISEKLNTQFRAEFFNVLNHTNFGQPNFMVFTGSPGSPQVYSPTAGQITTLNTASRQIQLALKLVF